MFQLVTVTADNSRIKQRGSVEGGEGILNETDKQLYKQFNLFPVVPTIENKKEPAKAWKKTDENHIYDTEKMTAKGYMIVCGEKSNIMVVDVDGKDRSFKYNFERLTIKADLDEAEIQQLRDTLIVKTPNNGYHLYFKYREGLKNTVSKVSDEIDIRTQGGIIMGPGSEIMALDDSLKKYNFVSGSEIKEMPEKLFQYMLNNQGTKKTPGKNPGGTMQIVIGEVDPFISLKGMKEGEGRNDKFFRLLIAYCKSKNIRELAVMESIAESVQRDYFETPEPGLMATVKSVHEKLSEEVSYIYQENGKDRINTALLSKYISDNSNYMIVRKNGFDIDLLYWYQDGRYKKISVNEMKGRIKEFIPLIIRKASMFDEVYKQLITDKSTIMIEDLDQERKYINYKNGLYNVETKTLEPHTPDILSTIQINAYHDDTARHPQRFFKYLDSLTENDESLKAILQEWAGLTISNFPGFKPKKAMALYGPTGDTGKSVYVNILNFLLGTENVATRDIQELSKPFATSDLYGKAALLIDDQKDSNFTDSSIFKSITSGGLVPCEFKGKQNFSYVFNGTVTFACNELPYLTGEKGSHFYERLMIIPCYNVLPEKMRDPNLLDHLKTEIEGINKWALEGLHRLIENNFKFTQSDASKMAVEEYRMKSDSLFRFVNEHCIFTGNKEDRILKATFENDYEAWANENDVRPIMKKNIKDRAQKMNIKYAKSSSFYYMGVKYKLDAEDIPAQPYYRFNPEYLESLKEGAETMRNDVENTNNVLKFKI